MSIIEKYLPPPIPSAEGSTAVQKTVDIRSVIASEWTRDKLQTIAATTPRGRQARLGPSEIGQQCPRRLAYRIAGTPIVNLPDPLKAMFGTGMHGVIADGLRRLDNGTGRFLIEHEVNYRGVLGHVDLYDRWTKRLIDWKTTGLERIRKYQSSGVSVNYAVQSWIYAEGLRELGEMVEQVALVFIPRDGTLRDVWTWVTTPNPDQADQWIDRYIGLTERVEEDGPAVIEAVPSSLCPWCPNYRPTSRDLEVACPGGGEQR